MVQRSPATAGFPLRMPCLSQLWRKVRISAFPCSNQGRSDPSRISLTPHVRSAPGQASALRSFQPLPDAALVPALVPPPATAGDDAGPTLEHLLALLG